MLKAVINNQEIDIAEPVQVVMQSPWLGSESTYSFGIVFHNTTEVRKALGDLHLPEYSKNKIEPKNGYILSDALNINGAFYFKSANDEYFEYDFVGAGNFFDEAKNINIRDIDYDAFVANYYQYYNKNFFDEFPYNITNYKNVVNDDPFYGHDTASVPHLRLTHLLSQVVSKFGFKCERNDILNIDNFGDLYLFSNTSNTNYSVAASETYGKRNISLWNSDGKIYLTIRLTFGDVGGLPVIITPVTERTFDLVEGDYIQIYNCNIQHHALEGKIARIEEDTDTSIFLQDIDATEYDLDNLEASIRKINLVSELGAERKNNHIPDLSVYDFINEICILFNAKIFPSQNRKAFDILLLNDIINNPLSIDITEHSETVDNDGYNEDDGYTFRFGEDSDDNYLKENFQEITDNLNTKDCVATIDDLPISGSENNDLCLVEDENSYYIYEKLGLGLTSGWRFYSKKHLTVTEGSGDLEISTRFLPMLTYHDGNQLFMRYDAKGVFLSFNEENKSIYRLFFWRGNGHSVDGNYVYPICTPDIYDHKGNPVEGATWAIRWAGENGMIKKFHEDYLYWQLNIRKEFTCQVNWPLELLNNFDFAKKYRILYTNYFVKSITFTIHQDKIVFGETELAKA